MNPVFCIPKIDVSNKGNTEISAFFIENFRRCLLVQDPTKPCNHTIQCPLGWQCVRGPNLLTKLRQNDWPRSYSSSCSTHTNNPGGPYPSACYCQKIVNG